MAKQCKECGKKLPFLSKGELCKECKQAFESELARIEKEIITTKDVTEQQLDSLKKQNKETIINLYSRIYEDFEADKELEDKEMETLQKIQEKFGLTNEEVNFNDRIRPYAYASVIRSEGKLPTPELHLEGAGQIIFKKNETAHFADFSILKEIRSVSLGYKGGSHGASIRIAKGVRYRVGAHRGHIQKEDRLVETSRGFLLVTNQRLFLHPLPGHKPVSIPLNKILSYQCYQNGLEVYKEGREKGYMFATSPGSVEIFGLCLGHLLEQ